MANNALRGQNPTLIVKEIQDVYLRKNFQALQDYFNAQNQLYGFKYFEIEFTEAQTNFRQAHGLQTLPCDVVLTNIAGDGEVTFNKGLFSLTEFDLTVTGACRISFFLGTYWDKQTPTNPKTTDTQSFKSAIASSGVLTGEIKIWPGAVIPSGYVLCDGKQYSADKYPDLASVLYDTTNKRYAWGGNGTYPQGVFNVPDLRGVVPRGVSGDSTTDPDSASRTALNQGGNDGNKVGTYQADIVGPHIHSQWQRGNWTFATGSTGGSPNGSGNIGQGESATSMLATTLNVGIGNETRMKNVAVNYIIKT